MPLFLNDKLLHNAIAAAVRKYGKNGLVDEIEKLKARIAELENRRNPSVYHPVNEVHVATPQTTLDKVTGIIEDVPRETIGTKETNDSVISSFPGEPIDSVIAETDDMVIVPSVIKVEQKDSTDVTVKKRGRPKRS